MVMDYMLEPADLHRMVRRTGQPVSPGRGAMESAKIVLRDCVHVLE